MDDHDHPPAWQLWRISGVGLLFAAAFFAASLTPSLVPRTPVTQGGLAGVSALAGYGVGALLHFLWRLMLLPVTTGRAAGWGRVFLGLFALALAIWALTNAAAWQDATRRVMELDPVDGSHPFVVAGVAGVVFVPLLVAAVGVLGAMRLAGRTLSRVLPGRMGPVLGGLLALYLVWAMVNDVIVRRVLELADGAFASGEQVVDADKPQPTDPMMTGSPASPIDWKDLGNRGRDFIARTPTAEEIAAFWGEGARRPVRVYVGRVSAPTPLARAELALAELIRQGGFDRELLIVTTPVGTGWMDPGSHDSIDFMFGGNTAHVGAQYSYLTSVLSILTNVDYGIDQARALFDVVYDHWAALPPDDRPKLYIQGLSQGALNSQIAFPLLDVLGDPPDGALWAGSPFVSPVWAQVRRDRQQDSPVWRPRLGNGSLVRVANQDGFEGPFTEWGPIRLVFLHYGSDPIVNFDIASIWRRPEFLTPPRAPDVAPEVKWYPLVTAFQGVLDMTAALGVAGYGHFYIARDYIDAWATLTDPPGWSAARAEELKAIFAARPDPW